MLNRGGVEVVFIVEERREEKRRAETRGWRRLPIRNKTSGDMGSSNTQKAYSCRYVFIRHLAVLTRSSRRHYGPSGGRCYFIIQRVPRERGRLMRKIWAAHRTSCGGPAAVDHPSSRLHSRVPSTWCVFMYLNEHEATERSHRSPPHCALSYGYRWRDLEPA